MAKKKGKGKKSAGSSLADIQAELTKEEDISSLPMELQLVTGAAKDSAESQQRGPEVWGPIWAERSPTKPYDDGTKPKTYSWALKNGESGLCVIAQLPLPIVVHTVAIGRGTSKRGGKFYRREKVRCLGLKYGFDPDTKAPKVLSTGVKCPMCALLGDRWSIIQVGGVIDLRPQNEPMVDKRGITYHQPPRLLVLDSDSTQRAVSDGLKERHLRGLPVIGTVFKVQRGMEQNASRVGTNWVAQLDKTVEQDQIDTIYYPVDIDRCYPVLDGAADNVFPAKRHEELVTAIMQRHVSMYLKHDPGKGFDAHVAKELGLKLDDTAAADDEDDEDDAPASRGLGMISLEGNFSGPTETPTPGLTDLGDKIDDEDEDEEAGVEEAEEAEEEEEAEEAEEGEDEEEETIEDLQARLLDKEETPIQALVAEAQELGVEPVRDKKGKVKRKATIKAIVEYWESQDEEEEEGEESEEEGNPWDD